MCALESRFRYRQYTGFEIGMEFDISRVRVFFFYLEMQEVAIGKVVRQQVTMIQIQSNTDHHNS